VEWWWNEKTKFRLGCVRWFIDIGVWAWLSAWMVRKKKREKRQCYVVNLWFLMWTLRIEGSSVCFVSCLCPFPVQHATSKIACPKAVIFFSQYLVFFLSPNSLIFINKKNKIRTCRSQRIGCEWLWVTEVRFCMVTMFHLQT